MSPPPSKDWWLAAALTGAALPAAFAQQPARPDGVITTVPGAGAPQPGSRHAPLVVTQANGQRFVTDDKTSVHVLFPDQSAMTIGPNSEVVLQQYQYDAQTKDGRFVVQMTKGIMRMVGGFISKGRAANVITPTATVGIRGGITVVRADPNQTLAAYLFGLELTMQQGGLSAFLARPGFGLQSGPNGIEPPFRITNEQLKELLAQLGENLGAGQGSGPPAPPSDSSQNTDEVAPDRVQGTTGFGDGPPTLNQLLGSPGPGNQS